MAIDATNCLPGVSPQMDRLPNVRKPIASLARVVEIIDRAGNRFGHAGRSL